MRKVAAAVDDLFGTVIRDAMELANKEDRMADSLVWLCDQAVFFAQHAEEVERLRRELEQREAASLSARTAVAQDVTTRPAGGTVVSLLDHVRGDR